MSSEPTPDLPLISVVMPVRDEGPYIEASLDALDRQTYPRDRIEIMVVDGGSSDDTTAIVAARAAADPRIQQLGGPGVNTPEAMNVGIAAARGVYVAKVDGHGWVNDDFLQTAARTLSSEPTVGCVGGQVVPVAETKVQRAIQIARFSRLGVGGGIYTAPTVVHDIDTVQCGVYRRDLLVAIGAFDPDLQFGEDEEVNHRVRAAGARIVFDPAMQFHYHVRPTLGSLFRQYRNYGRARVRVVRKHPDFIRAKHLLPAVLVVVLVAAIVLGILVDLRIALVINGGYVLGLAMGGGVLAAQARFRRPDQVAAALACLHLGYGTGTLAGLGDLLRSRR